MNICNLILNITSSMNYDKDLEKSWGDISEIVEQYLYNDLPSTFDGYLLHIGRRNLLHLLADVEQYMTDSHWMYVAMGRISKQKHLKLLKPELFLSFCADRDFVKIVLFSGIKRLINKLSIIDPEFIAATGGYGFYRVFHNQPALFINNVGYMMPKTFYPISLYPNYQSLKVLLLYEAINSRNLTLAMFILKPYPVELDKWVVKAMPLPEIFETYLRAELSKSIMINTINKDSLYSNACEYGMYSVAQLLGKPTLNNPVDVCGYLACAIASDDIVSVRELVKYDYNCDDTIYLCNGIDLDTSIEIIKLVNFTHINNARVRLYKSGVVLVHDLDNFSGADLPALLDPKLQCSDIFKRALLERISYPKFHPLANRNKYTKHAKRLLNCLR